MSLQVYQLIEEHKAKIKQWIHEKKKSLNNSQLPIYSSFDLRDNGYKAAIVDSNLFPAGFNNLDINAQKRAVEAFSTYIPTVFSGKQILIIPEMHTRNLYYLRNLKIIQSLLYRAGYKAIIGSLRKDIVDDRIELKDSKGENLILEKLFRNGKKVRTVSFFDDLILLNNDFSIQNPPLLDNLEQIILPPLKVSWLYRKKSTHFQYLDNLLDELAQTIRIDPWFLKTIQTHVNDINFKDTKSLPQLAKVVDETLEKIQEKYVEYGIKDSPYLFVKDNSGTYGRGIITVNSGSDILTLNSTKRKRMVYGKQKSKITSVIIQEGIQTIHSVGKAPAEPVIYSVGGQIVGGFTRYHPKKNNSENLNTPGMKFNVLFFNHNTRPILYGPDGISIYTILVDIATIAITSEYEGKAPC